MVSSLVDPSNAMFATGMSRPSQEQLAYSDIINIQQANPSQFSLQQNNLRWGGENQVLNKIIHKFLFQPRQEKGQWNQWQVVDLKPLCLQFVSVND